MNIEKGQSVRIDGEKFRVVSVFDNGTFVLQNIHGLRLRGGQHDIDSGAVEIGW